MGILPAAVRLDKNGNAPSDPRNFPALWHPYQTHIWKKGYFTVPLEVSEERVDFAAAKYRNKFGTALELEGFTVHEIEGPARDLSVVAVGTTDEDRKRYVMWAKVSRRPVTFTVDVPDEDVALYEKHGFKQT